jgi:serine/threonine protein kinase/tetratricopeptide (TPR) repeat protein
VSAEVLMGQVVEEFLDHLNRGERPEVESYVRRYPQLASVLRQMLPALELMRPPAEDLSAQDELSAPPSLLAGCLGDYRILREVGRGGMGVVYEAEQISLGRRVALKVLPFASTLDPRQLQRFKNEAHAAAQLHHTHIVPVYATGCERGVHYYAMQYVEGQTLAALIAELRQQAGRDPADPQRTGPYCPQGAPTRAGESTVPAKLASSERSIQSPGFFRTVAQLGIQAAQALEHAHQLGVVHRDIKPGNLLLERTSLLLGDGDTEEGLRLWVTDFGLAHLQSEAGLTLTGDLVGTLRYMSPEQALAQHGTIEHRTDIYSLGVTLYELLTLEPAFGGHDRQELLRQIACDEPKAPRRLNKAIPAELETIVLKGMEKNAADRYARAQELADDLERFLKDEPIRARRPSLVQRARKWARRHRPLVGSVVVVVLLAALMAGINGFWLAQKRAETAGAVAAVLQEVKDLQGQEKWPEALAAARRAEALLQLGGGSDDLRQQVQDVLRDLDMVRRLEDARLMQAGAGEKGGFNRKGAHAAYAEAFAWYGLDVEGLDPGEAGERVRSRPIRLLLAAALDDWAYIQKLLGLKGWRQLLAVSRSADPDPWRNRLRDALGGNDLRDAREGIDVKALQAVAASVPEDDLPPATAVLLGRLSGGTATVGAALAVLQKVRQRHPADFWVNHTLGWILHHLPRPPLEEAIRYYTAALAIHPHSPGARTNLALALRDKGRLDEAIVEYREALRLNKDIPEAHFNLGNALRDQLLAATSGRGGTTGGTGLFNPGKPPRDKGMNREDALRDKGQVLDEIIAEYREAIRLKKDYAEAHNNLGDALEETGQIDEAAAEWCEAIRHKADLMKAHINLYVTAKDAVLDGFGKGDAAKLDEKQRARRRQQALDLLRADLEVWDKFLEKEPAKARQAAPLHPLDNSPALMQRMQRWLADPTFAGVRGENALAKLPEAERSAWQKFWADVADTLARAQAKPPPEKK